MITRKIIKSIEEKTNFDADGYSGAWLKGADGYAYSVFVGNFPNYSSVAHYYPKSGKHYVSEHCPDDLKQVLMESWSTLPGFTKAFHSMIGL